MRYRTYMYLMHLINGIIFPEYYNNINIFPIVFGGNIYIIIVFPVGLKLGVSILI